MNAESLSDRRPRLVINADDFGYFPEVSEGIVDCITAGTVTATSILVHRNTPKTVFSQARSLDNADIGVHLNLSHGLPLTPQLGEAIDTFGTRFSVLASLAKRQISTDMIVKEWSAQIETVRGNGIDPVFLNSHEHLHMFPGLFNRFTELARRFSIRWIRVCRPEWSLTGSPGHWLRTAVFAATSAAAAKPGDLEHATLIGLAPSGRLQLDYLTTMLSKLQPGRVYELMCHPGRHTPADAGNLSDYHDWTGEYAALTGDEFPRLIRRANVRLSSFSALGNHKPGVSES